MKRISWTIAFLLAGCGGSPDDAATDPLANSTLETPSTSSPVQVTIADTPAGVVSQFYDALRDGDNTTIAQLLTDKAREETAKNGLKVLSQENSALTYQVGETEYVTEELDGAHVASLWIEPDERSQPVSTEVVWILRKQTNGWRVAGFAQLFDNNLPVLFDLESAEDTLRAKEYVDTEYYGRQTEPPMQTANPELPATGDTRLR